MLKKLVLASNNAGKLREFSALLAPLGCQVIAQGELNVPEAEEPFHTFIENALAKARHASRLTGLPALADDSGLCVDALGGAPGVLSARFAGEPKSDARNNAALLAALDGKTPRSGHYYCVLVLVRHADDPQPIIADGVWRGQVLSAAQGDGGFGYDPLFQAQGESVSVAEMDAAAKNAVSHRGQAMRALAAKLAELGQA
ncbi:RdgB/HAM1 family non-canonical purine NTP pyrophosphatase [Rivihabitans pingtungensis]|jgi:XTP/dITP diphosphohydrolase|uniref:RdgB/HAM1 family non-canonical purine NTP pyrophosphatase n=1 Tax=Rivihabitans pingtungensis TaxID=1054498 RepID=UPI002B54D195|nr:RdgB/HAM1 family non-canonical purine NTP pyrophosphatase [Rivihabitans pingtungensis]HNX72397.1 RdgB/HAM1 family non-canonical purine NTP pyrophosphatase [Rivihabitans pingtungensis]